VATTTAASGAGRRPALDVEELLRAEVGAEAGLRDHDVAQREAVRVAMTELQPWAMLPNGPAWMNAGVPAERLHQVGLRRP
jgi:hypothetical protein